MDQQIRFCTSADGTRIAYATYGNDDARPLIVTQTFETAQEYWSAFGPFYESLADGRRLVTFDRRGVGASQRDVDDLEMPAQVADLAAIVDHLGLESFDLLATGNGLALTAAYATEHPELVRRIVLWHPLTNTLGTPLRDLQTLPTAIRAAWPHARRSWATYAYPSGPAAMQRLFSRMLRDSIAPETAARHFDIVLGVDVEAMLPGVSAPTLVLANSYESEAASVRAFAELIPDASLITLDGDYGTLVLEPGKLVATIRNFLDEAEADPEPELPSGTAVILFADIANSTALTEQLGDAGFREKARALDDAIAPAIRDAGGSIVDGKLLGDGVLATFSSARQAIEAARRCRDASGASGLDLHLGIHAGDVIRERAPDGRDNVFGGAVNLAARIADASAPGEILVSDTLRGLARTSAGVAFEDRGEHELKGIAEPQRLFAVLRQAQEQREQEGGHAR